MESTNNIWGKGRG